MYKMRGRSKIIRLLIFPLWLPLWAVGLLILILNLTFEHLWGGVDFLRDKFESWVNRIAPLD